MFAAEVVGLLGAALSDPVHALGVVPATAIDGIGMRRTDATLEAALVDNANTRIHYRRTAAMKPQPMQPALHASIRRWPLREPFVISRRVFTENIALEVVLTADGVSGRGESEPHEHDTAVAEAAREAASALDPEVWSHLDPERLNAVLPRSPVRTAVDCALWDLLAKRAGRRAWELLGIDLAPDLRVPVFETLSLDTPDRMAAAAAAAAAHRAPGLKLKLGHGDGRDAERLEAVHAAAPGAVLTIDANEGWSPDGLRRILPLAARLGVVFIEQPLPAGADEALTEMPRLVPFCADESCLDRSSLPRLLGRYQLINIKLDKTGGLTEALHLIAAAKRSGLGHMVGCNGGSSLAQAPALLLTPGAVMVDLGVHGLADDRPSPLGWADHRLSLPEPALWG
ncbi:dipeptide epimerase [Silanimonas sp.]|uniref:dipeptide epimerase n=1 Tax=Silanimonas sp. TaxID=1929290 RepID=UPI0022C2ACE6|nr:dipeptide epimerase [Silanimonas sp.]MCZ8116211.1 dipeptide epimerase [Silanimonas sp.]